MTTPAPPVFAYAAYGVNLTWVGEDGGMAAEGHVPLLRFVAACNRMAREEGGWPNLADDRSAMLDDVLGGISHEWAVPAEPPYPAEAEWRITWGGVTEHTPGAIPVTLYWP